MYVKNICKEGQKNTEKDMGNVMANYMRKVEIRKKVSGDRVKQKRRTRVVDYKQLEEKAKKNKKKKQ